MTFLLGPWGTTQGAAEHPASPSTAGSCRQGHQHGRLARGETGRRAPCTPSSLLRLGASPQESGAARRHSVLLGKSESSLKNLSRRAGGPTRFCGTGGHLQGAASGQGHGEDPAGSGSGTGRGSATREGPKVLTAPGGPAVPAARAATRTAARLLRGSATRAHSTEPPATRADWGKRRSERTGPRKHHPHHFQQQTFITTSAPASANSLLPPLHRAQTQPALPACSHPSLPFLVPREIPPALEEIPQD